VRVLGVDVGVVSTAVIVFDKVNSVVIVELYCLVLLSYMLIYSSDMHCSISFTMLQAPVKAAETQGGDLSALWNHEEVL